MTPTKNQIGLLAATSIVAGSIIGSGIFMKPATMAAQVGSPVWLIGVWVVTGLFSLFGALIYAELGAMFPQTGGQYVYFRHMYGNFVAFLYGWAAFAVINTAAVAAISFVCAQYADQLLHLPQLISESDQLSIAWRIPFLGKLYPLQNFSVKLLAILLVLIITFLNYLTLRGGSLLQLIATIIKIGLIGALVLGIMFSGNGNASNFVSSYSASKSGWALAGGVVAALTGGFMAYDGWINLTFMAGELKDPKRNIVRSLIAGVSVCICVYVLVNLAYLYVLPVNKMAASPLVAYDAVAAAWGQTSSNIVAALIVICTFGAINGNAMAVARVTYAMGRDKLFFTAAGKEHPRFHTPGNALWMHCSWAALLIMSGSFDMLADMFTFVTWLAYLLGGIGIFVLRKKIPDHPRPYRAWGYPFIPILFIAFSGFYLVSTIWNDINNYIGGHVPVINSLLGIGIVVLGAPLYWYFRKKN